jgi:hypothetical protein
MHWSFFKCKKVRTTCKIRDVFDVMQYSQDKLTEFVSVLVYVFIDNLIINKWKQFEDCSQNALTFA